MNNSQSLAIGSSSSVLAGRPYPLGSTVDNEGVNFAIFSAHATRIELCFYDQSGQQETDRYVLPKQTNQVWHGYVPQCQTGQLYGFRVYGLYEPSQGLRFNPSKLSLDPYCKSLVGKFIWHNSHYSYACDQDADDLILDSSDNAQYLPKCQVIDMQKYQGIKPQIPWHDTIIYECHVKGTSQLNEQIEPTKRGSFLGLADLSFIKHLKELGVTAIELLPVHQFISERFLQEQQLVNYWGYNTLSFFSPHGEYLVDGDINEFKAMVSLFHQHGIEVILDVVYNHTAEGNRLGPNLSWRGIDNLSYYRLQAQQNRYYVNDTGCGNTLNVNHPRCLQMIVDSLRYWVEYMGIDGFRFDLAPILGREPNGFASDSSFFQTLLQDPVINQVKLIAEPWDIGPGGYQLGAFPIPWGEWNDRFRDTIRRFWRGDIGLLPEFARRLHGSSDIFEHNGRSAYTSINFITSHDGFSLNDLVSFNDKHNEENGEQNRDGHSENLSYNYGEEGETDNEEILQIRRQQKKNLLLTLILAQGVPMIRGGDELSHSQQGNNNAYCQDNECNWIDWQKSRSSADDLTDFIRQVITIRQTYSGLRHDEFIHDDNTPFNISWLNKTGEVMSEKEWGEHSNSYLGYLVSDKENEQHLLCLFNAHSKPLTVQLPELCNTQCWQRLLNTAEDSGDNNANELWQSSHDILIQQRSTWVLTAIANNQITED